MKSLIPWGLSCFVLALACGAAAAQETERSTAERPDIVVFLSDDHTLTDSSLYGASDIETPNMERVAAAGMTFDRAYVASPSCAPSRAAMLTGLMPARNGAEPNHARPRAEIKKLPAYLQPLGYEVVSFGKVGHYAQTPEYGFDLARHYGYHEDVAVGEAVKWLKERDSDQPLCLFVGTNWPHVPWPDATTIDASEIEIPLRHVHTPQTRQMRAKYYQAIRTMDDELGRVFDAAYEKLGDDTLFLHTSDHGAQWPFAKWNLYEDGIRTPMIAAWPGRIAEDVRSDAFVCWVDLLPTLVEAAGGEVNGELDGRSFLPVLSGQSDSHRSEIFTAHSGDGNFNVFPSRSVRGERYKYIRNLHPEFEFRSHVTHAKGPNAYWPSWQRKAQTNPDAAGKVDRYLHRPAEELFDLKNDPREQHNLAGDPAHADQLAAMRETLAAWMQQQGDQQKVYGMPRLRPTSGTPPNIITVFIDDMGWQDLSCFGGEDVETTHIDRLSREGVRFTNFYVNAPICSPSRTALTTGQYPARHRITSFLARRQKNRQRGMAQWLDASVVTLPRLMAEKGYRTGHFGKWHMGGQRDVGEAPLITEYGFDASLTNFEGLGPRVLPLCDAYDGSPLHRHDLGSADLGRGPIEWEDRSKITGRFVDRAIEFIDASAALDKPFYLNLWPDDVHSPFFPPKELRGDESKRELYLGVLKEMDNQFAALFDRIRNDEKLRDNTLIVVASDNGHEPGAGSGGPLRGAKGDLYEGGIRSPLIVWGPGLVEPDAAGSVNETTILSSVDLVRSLITLANLSPPDDYESDGEDLLAALLGKSSAQRSGALFWRRPPDRPGPKNDPNPDLAVRDGKWKLLCDVDGSAAQLYDLEADIGESNNVAKKHPRVTRRLTRAVIEWNATLPVDGVMRQAESRRPLPPGQFVNPIAEGADPSVVKDGQHYLWCQSEGNRGVAIWRSDRLTSLGTKHVVWEAPESGPLSRQVWAPELIRLDDRWYIYFAASDGDNANHRTYVLESETDDPLGEYSLHGPLYTGDHFDSKRDNLWAIDMTVLEHGGRRYAIWSGWTEAGSDQQRLYIAPMKSPTKLAGPRVQLCEADDYLWERVEENAESRGLNEAPQVLQRGGRTFVVYSCAASWLPTYKLGMLELTGDDPLDPAAWKKFSEPVFQSTDSTFGVGHGGFVRSGDDSQWWHVYHAKRDRRPGWRRVIHVQRMSWSEDGLPEFGRPVAAGEPLKLPSGTLAEPTGGAQTFDFRGRATRAAFDYYGHHQMLDWSERGVALGVEPETIVNGYRSGEKLVARNRRYGDAEITARFSFVQGDRDAGILFRVTAPAVGFDAQRGYFAGLIPRRSTVILGKMDGRNWHHLADAPVELDRSKEQQLRVRTEGDLIEVFAGGAGEPAISFRDTTYPRGTVGVRVVHTGALFHELAVTPLGE